MRTMELSTASPPVALTVGACVCKEGYGDKSKLSTTTPDYVCAACGTNVATCSFSTANQTVGTTDTCKTGFYKAGNDCVAAATTLDGYFWVSTTSTYTACDPTCLKCTGAEKTKCAACLPQPANWAEPLSNQTNYTTVIKGTRALINGTCLGVCPDGFGVNTARTDCVAGKGAYTVAGADSGASTGVFAIFALIIAFISLI
jgi:hypothetical protein